MRNRPRKIVLAGAALLLPLPFFIAALAVGELYVRALGPDQIPPFTPCQQYDPELRHRYAPNCRSSAPSAQGMIDYAFNEDGLRDRSRDAFAKGAVVVLGDSITEGLFLHDEQTIPRQLEQKAGGGLRFLNAGVRFTSPSTQRLLYRKLVAPHYPVRAVVWLLNASDPTDERLFHAEAAARDEEGLPTRFAWFGAWSEGAHWLTRLNQWNQGRSRLVSTLVRLATFGIYQEKIASVAPTREVLCPAIRNFARALKADDIPLLIAFTPHPSVGIEANWGGLPYRPEELGTMVECARETGAAVADLTAETLAPDYFAADQIHYSPRGAEWVAEKLKSKMPPLKPDSAPVTGN